MTKNQAAIKAGRTAKRSALAVLGGALLNLSLMACEEPETAEAIPSIAYQINSYPTNEIEK